MLQFHLQEVVMQSSTPMVQATSCALTPIEDVGTAWEGDPLHIFVLRKVILLEPDPVLIKGSIYLQWYLCLNSSVMLISQVLD